MAKHFMTSRQRVHAERLYRHMIGARLALERKVDDSVSDECWRHACWLVTGRWPTGHPVGEAGPPPFYSEAL